MSQRPTIGAFRARLRKIGYEDISIKRLRFSNQELNRQDLYLVSAREPLTCIKVMRVMSYMDMFYWR